MSSQEDGQATAAAPEITEETETPTETATETATATTVAEIPAETAESESTAAVVEAAAKISEAEQAKVERLKKKEESEELTKQLQKLALERQKDNRNERLKVIQSDTSSHLSSARTFQELDLPKYLLDAIFEMGFERPSAIQEEALPRILAKQPRNLIGQAQSGSGKTAAFVIGMLYRIKVDTPATTQALCVTPTRELAVQIVNKTIVPMAKYMSGLKIKLALGGEQMARGEKINAHLVVGTPGKVVDWLKRRVINSKTIKVFVLDEADHMVGEDGHRANSLLAKKAMPRSCQSLFFSATFPDEVVDFATKMVSNPDKILIEAGPEFLVLDVIKQLWVDTQGYEGGKLQFLSDIYSLLTIGQSIVFVATKVEANAVHRTLTESGYMCSVLHGQIGTGERDRTMEAFRNGESSVLIATNVLARGVDVDNVCLVVNYDVPLDKYSNPDFETYLHRIGRTGRFGRKGTAINLVNDQRSIEVLAAIEAHFSTNGKEMIANAPADPEELAEMIEI
eukprot:CAMPEP_0203680054 /NCGR_PEP_ID=MMETSP0090-20130426/37819_1 /ASSEMBLY_ACC=CAM_ASM_001088 /TAXON_ID=426623 /ORGANISM="Chaetoceros affinis, Strain CCMP159" /LENGTH=509 /DNA_ID=CAMNT_0050547943 /DNA_START=235 /DNA_END=1764 /DNA_ORIENTATION=-